MKDNQQELFIVVDENDNILEYRTRYDCHHDNSLIHRAIAIVIYNDKGEIALQKRSVNKDLNPGMYTNAVGGHVEKGQTYEEAAQREMKEELGIDVPIKFVKKFISRNDQETHMVSLFEATYNGPFHLAKDEVDMIEFVKPEDIKNIAEKLTPHARVGMQQLGLL
jgi:isopentenyl-diphosphate delta-isomerase type 1